MGSVQGLTAGDSARICAIEKSQADLKGDFNKVLKSAEATNNTVEELKLMFSSFMSKSKDNEHGSASVTKSGLEMPTSSMLPQESTPALGPKVSSDPLEVPDSVGFIRTLRTASIAATTRTLEEQAMTKKGDKSAAMKKAEAVATKKKTEAAGTTKKANPKPSTKNKEVQELSSDAVGPDAMIVEDLSGTPEIVMQDISLAILEVDPEVSKPSNAPIPLAGTSVQSSEKQPDVALQGKQGKASEEGDGKGDTSGPETSVDAGQTKSTAGNGDGPMEESEEGTQETKIAEDGQVVEEGAGAKVVKPEHLRKQLGQQKEAEDAEVVEAAAAPPKASPKKQKSVRKPAQPSEVNAEAALPASGSG